MQKQNELLDALNACVNPYPSHQPAELRFEVIVTRRGEVRVVNQSYFAERLVPMHGEEVVVQINALDDSSVWVFDLGGVLIGEALLEGRCVHARPRHAIDATAEAREKGQLSRLATKAKAITGQDVDLVVTDPQRPQRPDFAEQKAEDGEECVAQGERTRPIVIRKRGNQCWWVYQGRKVVAFAGSFEWAMTRRDMIRDGVLDVPAMEPALKLVS